MICNGNGCVIVCVGLALEKDKEREAAKRHTMSHPPDHIPELDSPRQSRSPLKKSKKEQVGLDINIK